MPVTRDDTDKLIDAGRRAVQSGDGEAALAVLRQAIGQSPRSRTARYWLANALRLAGRADEAETLFRALIAEDPADDDAGFGLAWLLREQGRPTAAAHTLVSLAQSTGHDLPDLLKIAGFLRDSNRFDEAIGVLLQARSLRPDDPGLAFRLGRLYQATGRFEEAREELHRALAGDPSLGGAWLSLAQVQRFEDANHPDLCSLRAAAKRRLGPEAELCAAFALGKACDDLGDWSGAWRAFERGNRLRRAMQPWDRALHERRLEGWLAAPVPSATDPGLHRRALYVVGMLRSGTTLVEQLLARHPRVTARGELNQLAHQAAAYEEGRTSLADAGKSLWTHLRLDGPEDCWYIDKNPLNFRFLGFLTRALPEARIVHLRRDPRDTCLSCYFQLFGHPDAAFADSLDDLAHYYHGYRRLMTHWESRLSGQLLPIRYEAVVSDAGASLEPIRSALGLNGSVTFDENAAQDRPIRTASAWQARQPVHGRSVGRWENYHVFAPRFFDALAELDHD